MAGGGEGAGGGGGNFAKLGGGEGGVGVPILAMACLGVSTK